MCIIADRKPKMPAGVLAGPLDNVLAAADELDDRERKIRKMHGVGRTPLFQKSCKRWLIGLHRQMFPIFSRNSYNSVPSLGRFNYAAEGKGAVRFEKLGHLDVGCDHEILDQFTC